MVEKKRKERKHIQIQHVFVRSALDGLALTADKWTSLFYIWPCPLVFLLSQSKIETSYSLHLGPTGLGVERRGEE